MKRATCLILLFSFLTFCFGGCRDINTDKSVTITILMDVMSDNPPLSKSDERSFQDVVNYFFSEKNIQLEFQYLSSDMTERNNQLANLRTEIMAGGGPDLFILPTWPLTQRSDNVGTKLGRNEPLFPDVEDAMRNLTFLNLNEFIANSEYYNQDEHLRIVMEAGNIDGNQYVMPLLFSYDMYLFEGDSISDSNYTYDELINEPYNGIGKNYWYWIHSTLGEYIDYETEELKISESELSLILEEVCGIWSKDQSLSEINDCISCVPIHDFELFSLHASNGKFTPYVIPNKAGGITATITAYAAINANSETPEEAFNIIELFFTEELQDDSCVRIEKLESIKRIPFDNNASIGADSGIKTGLSNYSELHYPTCWSQIQDIHERINYVKFRNETDCVLYDICEQIMDKQWDGEEIDFDAIAAELYSDWKMMVAE